MSNQREQSMAHGSMSSTSQELCFASAITLAGLIREKAVSAREVTEAPLAQIVRLNPHVNAIVTLVGEQALKQCSLYCVAC